MKLDGLIDCLLGKRTVFVLLCLGIIVIVGLLITFYSSGYGLFGNDLQLHETEVFGAFFGGVAGTIFALAGTILIYLTFRNQSKFNEAQHNFNQSQRYYSEVNTIWKMANDVGESVKTFNQKSTIKLDTDTHKTLKGVTGRNNLWKVYDDIAYITNLCLLAYDFVLYNTFLSEDKKKPFYETIWFHSKNVAAYWEHCSKENRTYAQHKKDEIKIKENEINTYLKRLKEYNDKYQELYVKN